MVVTMDEEDEGDDKMDKNAEEDDEEDIQLEEGPGDVWNKGICK